MRSDWADVMANLFDRVAELERRVQNKKRMGTIAEVDAAKGLARVKLSEGPDGKPFLSPWVPWKMPAMGATKINIPPSVGQQVDVVSESGDLADGVIDNALRSNDNPLPDAQPGESVITTGSTKIYFGPDAVRIESPTILLKGVVHLGDEGGQLLHRKGDTDSDGDAAVGSATKVYAV